MYDVEEWKTAGQQDRGRRGGGRMGGLYKLLPSLGFHSRDPKWKLRGYWRR